MRLPNDPELHGLLNCSSARGSLLSTVRANSSILVLITEWIPPVKRTFNRYYTISSWSLTNPDPEPLSTVVLTVDNDNCPHNPPCFELADYFTTKFNLDSAGNLYFPECANMEILTQYGELKRHGPSCTDHSDERAYQQLEGHGVKGTSVYYTSPDIDAIIWSRRCTERKRQSTWQFTPPTDFHYVRVISSHTGGVMNNVDPMVFEVVTPEHKDIWPYHLYPHYDWALTSFGKVVYKVDYPGSLSWLKHRSNLYNRVQGDPPVDEKLPLVLTRWRATRPEVRESHRVVLPSCETWPWEYGNTYTIPTVSVSPRLDTPGIWGYVWRLIEDGEGIASSILPFSHIDALIEKQFPIPMKELFGTELESDDDAPISYAVRWLEGDDGHSVYQIVFHGSEDSDRPVLNRDRIIQTNVHLHQPASWRVYYLVINYCDEYRFPSGELKLSDTYFQTGAVDQAQPDSRPGDYTLFMAGMMPPYTTSTHANWGSRVAVGAIAADRQVIEMSKKGRVQWQRWNVPANSMTRNFRFEDLGDRVRRIASLDALIERF